MTEIKITCYLPIPDYSDYYISDDGRVYSRKSQKELKQRTFENGYKYVSFKLNKKDKIERVHRLVAMVFCKNDDPINKTIVDHIDNNKLNNHYSNLRWVTISENGRNKNNSLNKRNKIGIKGLSYKEQNEKGNLYKYIIANAINNDGKKILKNFNIDKLGYENAVEMAKNWRKEMEEKFYN